MESVLVGAFKVKDGLFIGDEFAAQDLEFVVANKVSRIINCAARQVPNHWEPIGITYISFPWFDTENQVLLDTSDKNFSLFYMFIEKGLETGESVLVHSVRGVSRCVCVVTAYLIKKYQWSLYKALDFIAFRRPDLDLNPAFLTQLSSFENRLTRITKVPRSDKWDQLTSGEEELALRNTFLNARLGQPTDYHLASQEPDKALKLRWDENNEQAYSKAKNKTDEGLVVIRSCLKGTEKVDLRVPSFNLQSLQERSAFARFGKDAKPSIDEKIKKRSASLNKNDNKLVKEAISATRGFLDDDMKVRAPVKGMTQTMKAKPVTKVSRPTTAPQKRNLSPRGSEKKGATLNPMKGQSFGTIKKKGKQII
jgi:protein-tyrosine phosphatase